MRGVLQRVKNASVTVDGEVVGKIDHGILLLLGVTETDTEADADYICDKTINARIFCDEEDKMNLSLLDVGGSVLAVSQFTLYGDARKGRRPSFIRAAKGEISQPLYDLVCNKIAEKGVRVEKGIFGADMKVELLNDGPVTILLESDRSF